MGRGGHGFLCDAASLETEEPDVRSSRSHVGYFCQKHRKRRNVAHVTPGGPFRVHIRAAARTVT